MSSFTSFVSGKPAAGTLWGASSRDGWGIRPCFTQVFSFGLIRLALHTIMAGERRTREGGVSLLIFYSVNGQEEPIKSSVSQPVGLSVCLSVCLSYACGKYCHISILFKTCMQAEDQASLLTRGLLKAQSLTPFSPTHFLQAANLIDLLC